MIANKHAQRALGEFSERIYSEGESSYADVRAVYRDDWVLFAEDILGIELYDYQKDILRLIHDNQRVAVKALRGVGKTTLAAIVILAVVTLYGDPYDSTNDVKVVCTAGRYRQLEEYLFPEVRKWALRANWAKIGIQMRTDKELLRMAIRLGNRLAFAASPDKPEGIEGAHARTLLFVVDEAKITPNEVWDAMEGAFSSASVESGDKIFAFAISTPGAPLGRFYDILKRKPGYEDWHTYNILYEQAVTAGRIDVQWAEQRLLQWGEDDPRYQNQVLGHFADSSEYSVYKLSWLEAAQERWYEGRDAPHEGAIAYGCDPADTGEDLTSICRWEGYYLDWIQTFDAEVMQTIPIMKRLLGVMSDPKEIPIGFDSVGVGAGAYQTLRKDGYKVISLKGGASAKDLAGLPIMDAFKVNTFNNLRSAMYWQLRDALDPNSPAHIPIALPPDERLMEDLLAHEWEERGGVIHILPKDKVKEKIGRSPDRSDSVVYGFYVRRDAKKRPQARRI